MEIYALESLQQPQARCLVLRLYYVERVPKRFYPSEHNPSLYLKVGIICVTCMKSFSNQTNDANVSRLARICKEFLR